MFLFRFMIVLLSFISIYLIAQVILPWLTERLHRIQSKKVSEAERQLENMFMWTKKEKLFLLYSLSPLVLGGTLFFLFNHLGLALIGGGIGFILPTIVIKIMEQKRKTMFANQLVDALMNISSSLKGGLSLLQAFEDLVEDMSPPISQEFGVVLRENKMGLTIEESLRRLNERMKLEELSLMINSILVARETGGDLTKVFSRLANTIRDNRKLKESVRTLTLQGRLQAVIMSIMPFAFVAWVLSIDRNHFDIMLNTEEGKILLGIAVVLEVIGLILIRRFSVIKV